jgi:hypothetical protein
MRASGVRIPSAVPIKSMRYDEKCFVCDPPVTTGSSTISDGPTGCDDRVVSQFDCGEGI